MTAWLYDKSLITMFTGPVILIINFTCSKDTAAILSVEGRMFPVDVHYSIE